MSRPLAGVRVVVTRAERQAGELAERLAAAGASVELLPLLEVVPPADPAALTRAAGEVQRYDWLVFSSANAVTAFLPLVHSAGQALPGEVKSAVIGPATAAALRSFGVEPRIEALESRAEGMAEALALHVAGKRVLLPQAADARPALAEGLLRAGADVEAVVAYDKKLPPESAAIAARLFAAPPLGWVTFTSPRIAHHFSQLFGREWERRRAELRAASVGRVTSAELRRLGVERIAEAARPSDEELVRAIVEGLAEP